MHGYFQVILFDIGSASHKMSEMKQELFEKAGIGIPHEDIETNDVAIFGYVTPVSCFTFPNVKENALPFLDGSICRFHWF